MFIPSGRGGIVRIGVFFDGGYFNEVSNYYKFAHARQSRLSIQGVHNFIRHKAAEKEGVDVALCQIVDSHYFRGRFTTDSVVQAGKIEDERRFDEVLMRAGVVSHYLPLDESGARPQERGIDLWLSLEAFDLAVRKDFEIVALVACDGDYVPLVHKLNGLGTRVMLLAWDFTYDYEWQGESRHKETRTSIQLIEAATYPLMMHQIIDDRSSRDDPAVKGLFIY